MDRIARTAANNSNGNADKKCSVPPLNKDAKNDRINNGNAKSNGQDPVPNEKGRAQKQPDLDGEFNGREKPAYDEAVWKRQEKREPILIEDKARHIPFPIKYHELYDFACEAEKSIWPKGDVELENDLKDWNSINNAEKHYLRMVLAFFAAADGIVAENLAAKFYDEVQNWEARKFFAQQIQQETVHNEVYALLIQTYVDDVKERDEMFRTLQDIPVIAKMRAWMLDYIRGGASFAERLVAFACVEGILFSAAFCAIYFFRKRGLLPGLMMANDRIARDEGLHCDFACTLYQELRYTQLPFFKVKEIVSRAVDLQREFVETSIPVAMIGMSSEKMCRYVEFCADRLVSRLGYVQTVYGSANPFDWMELQSLRGKTNFFEKKVPDYNRDTKDEGSVVSKEGPIDDPDF